MEIAENYRDLKKITRFEFLKEHGLGLLKETTSTFFNCSVSFLFEPLKQAEKNFGINLFDNPKRGCYPINENTFFVFARILDEGKLISGIGLVLKGKDISSHKALLNDFEGALSQRLSKSFLNYFEDCSLILGDDLVTHTICNFTTRGYIDYRRFHHLLSYFQKLRTTTFENKSFSTGIIITKSHFAYKKKANNNRGGDIFPLTLKKDLKQTLQIDRRYWYLVDGKQSYYLANNALEINHIFILDPSYKDINYIDNNMLSKTLKGGDVLFRIENEKQFSIINSDSTEFIYLENKWKMRNYAVIKKQMSLLISNENVINKLLFFVLLSSKRSTSSIIWVPDDLETISKLVMPNTLNKLIHKTISICEDRFINYIYRCISSDGVTIIDKKGFLQYFGCIVDISKSKLSGIKGTGESAAQILSSNGIAIKISQDGTIKFFFSNEQEPMMI